MALHVSKQEEKKLQIFSVRGAEVGYHTKSFKKITLRGRGRLTLTPL